MESVLSGVNPRRPLVSNGVMGMCLFIAAELMFFSGFLSAFIVARSGQGVWPPAGQPRLPVAETAFNTALLLFSAYTMWRATRAGTSKRWLLATLCLGAAFLALQGREWVQLLGFGLSSSKNIYGAFFYLIVGAHALHVLAATLMLGWLYKKSPRELGTPALYWYFVVFLWPVIYGVVYFA